MQLYRADQVPDLNVRRICRHSRAGSIIFFVIFAGACCVPACLGMHEAHKNWQGPWSLLTYIPVGLMALVIGLVVLLCLWGLLGLVKASFLPTNWFVKICDDGLLIQFRSYLNYRLPADVPSVVFIPYNEFASVGRTRQREAVATMKPSGSPSYRYVSYLDIFLNHDDTAELESAMDEDAKRQPPPGRFVTSDRDGDTPARLTAPDVVRIRWDSDSPRLENVIKLLSGNVQVRPTVKVDPGKDKLPSERLEQDILDALDRGDTITAVTLARKRYGLDLTKAHQFVEDLVAAPVKQDVLDRARQARS